MFTGIVEGTVVATVKDSALNGIKLLLVRLCGPGKPGELVVAGDASFQAGIGDFVTLIGSKEASLMFGKTSPPCDLAITGFVDRYNAEI